MTAGLLKLNEVIWAAVEEDAGLAGLLLGPQPAQRVLTINSNDMPERLVFMVVPFSIQVLADAVHYNKFLSTAAIVREVPISPLDMFMTLDKKKPTYTKNKYSSAARPSS